MSNQEHMTIEEAVRFLQDGAQEERLDPRMFRAAQTIVSQDDKIETLSHLLAGAEQAAIGRAEQITRLQNALQEVEDWGMNVLETLAGVGIIHPGDMEGPA